jgi:hypothetical protein
MHHALALALRCAPPILGGNAKLVTDGADSEGENAQTTLDDDGKRIVHLSGYKDGMTLQEQLKVGTTLEHESHRDGFVGFQKQQEDETTEAALAHSAFMMRVAGDSQYRKDMLAVITGDANLLADAQNYSKYMKSGDISAFNKYVSDTYDSSADYWKLIKDGSLAYDGSGWLKDEDGLYINKDGSHTKEQTAQTLGGAGIQGGLANILGVSSEEAKRIMFASGFIPDNKSATPWVNAANNTKVIQSSYLQKLASDGVIKNSNVIKPTLNNGNAFQNALNVVGKKLSVVKNGIVGLYEKLTKSKESGQNAELAKRLELAKTPKEKAMIRYNYSHPVDVDKCIPGSRVTQEFENFYTSPDGSFSERHAGVDKQKVGAESVYTPDGYWQVIGSRSDNSLILQEVGTDLHMTMIHLNPTEIEKQEIGEIYGPNQEVIPYPDGMYGHTDGNNPHVHFEFSNIFNGERKFVDPYTFKVGRYETYPINGRPYIPR